MTAKVTCLPVETDRGWYLRFMVNGVEVDSVRIRDHEAFELDLAAPPRPVLEAEATVVEEYPKKNSAKRTRKRSLKQENSLAKDLGGRRQLASGALPNRKGDVYVDGRLRVEAKFTYANSYRLELHTLRKIASEAKAGEIPAVILDFVDKLTSKTVERFVVSYYQDWKRVLNDK